MRKCFLTNLQNNLNSSRLKRLHFILFLPFSTMDLDTFLRNTRARVSQVMIVVLNTQSFQSREMPGGISLQTWRSSWQSAWPWRQYHAA